MQDWEQAVVPYVSISTKKNIIENPKVLNVWFIRMYER